MILRVHASGLAVLLLFVAIAPAWSADDAAAKIETPPSKLQTLTHRASELALSALTMLGVRYRYGGNTPDNGLDCSGLVRYVFKEAWDKDLPRTSKEISEVGQRVDRKSLQMGDLVFYKTLRRGFSHVGIYLGNNRFIHAPSTGGEVRIDDMEASYWKKRFSGARRISQSEKNQ